MVRVEREGTGSILRIAEDATRASLGLLGLDIKRGIGNQNYAFSRILKKGESRSETDKHASLEVTKWKLFTRLPVCAVALPLVFLVYHLRPQVSPHSRCFLSQLILIYPIRDPLGEL